MAAVKKSLVIPAIGEDVAEITFGCVAGDGMVNYDEDGNEFLLTLAVDDDLKEDIEEQVLEFWEDHKPSNAGDEPDNFDGLFWENDDGDTFITFRTQAEFKGKPNIIPISDAKNNKLDPEVFGNIGAGSTGRAIIGLKIYEYKKKAGVSRYLEGVRLVTFSPYTAGGLDVEEEDGDALGGGGAPAEDKPEKDKKKKKKSKK